MVMERPQYWQISDDAGVSRGKEYEINCQCMSVSSKLDMARFFGKLKAARQSMETEFRCILILISDL